MTKRKDFTNPATTFISQESIDAVDGKPEELTPLKKEGYKVSPKYIELKSKRYNALLQPSVFEAVKRKANKEGISVNEAVNRALKEYAER